MGVQLVLKAHTKGKKERKKKKKKRRIPSAIQWFFGKNPNFANHLRTWGEAGTVTVKTKMTPKVGNW